MLAPAAQAHVQRRGVRAPSHLSTSDTSTVVDTNDILQRYQHILGQLSQQAMEQQAEIHALRAALEHERHRTRNVTRSSGEKEKGGRRRHSVRRHLRRHKSSHHHRPHNDHRNINKENDEIVRREEGGKEDREVPSRPSPQVSLTLSPPTSLLISSIERDGDDADAELCSVATPRRMQNDNSTQKQNSISAARKGNDDNTDHDVNDLTPTPVAHADRQRVSSKNVSCSSGLTSSLLSLSKMESSSPTPHRTTAARRTDGDAPQTPQSRMQTLARSEHDAPDVLFDGHDAMDYLLTVFSTIKKQADGEESKSDRCDEATQLPQESGMRAGVARQLFGDPSADAPQALHEIRGQLPEHVTSVSNSANSSWKQRYDRIVAADEANKQQKESYLSSDLLCHRPLSVSPDHSASELVDELIHFFTF